MGFITYSELIERFPKKELLMSADGRKGLLSEIDPENPSDAAFFTLLSKLTDEQVLFLQWIGQNKDFENILRNQSPEGPFRDDVKWLMHAFFEDFRHFVGPYLRAGLIHLSEDSGFDERSILLSYTVNLPNEDLTWVEATLYRPFRNELDQQISSVKSEADEYTLLQLTDLLTQKSFIAAVNALSRTSYSERIHFVDSILLILRHPNCSSRLAKRILERLATIELNPEHRERINELVKTSRRGQLIAKKQKPFLQRISRKMWVGIFLLIVLTGLGIFLSTLPADEQTEPDDLELISSFEQFSPEERRSIDSLLRLHQKSQEEQENDQDKYLWMQGNDVSLALRQALKNERMEQLYNDWLLNANLHLNRQIQTCSAYSSEKEFTYPGVGKNGTSSGDQQIVILNESIYSVAIFSFEEKRKGKVEMTMINPGKQIVIYLNRNDHLLFVSGKDPASFNRKGVNGELPSKDFISHFCITDDNLYHSLSSIYKLSLPSQKRNKLLISGDDSTSFYVGDLYGILETIW